jgi:hypothetical protein
MVATFGALDVDLIDDGRQRYRWTAVTKTGLRVPLEQLPQQLKAHALGEYRATLREQGFYDPGDLQLEVAISCIDEMTYAFCVVAPREPDAWVMAATFSVMREFDRVTGPVEAISGRPRSSCPSWYFALQPASPG